LEVSKWGRGSGEVYYFTLQMGGARSGEIPGQKLMFEKTQAKLCASPRQKKQSVGV